MMNALGNAIDPSDFKDITDRKSLRAIAPVNVTGDLKRPPLVGYQKFFPNVQALWVDKQPLIELIMEQHDVTKHRFASLLDGKYRTDPPEGFFESLNVDQRSRFEFSPMEEILLEMEPKKPLDQRTGSKAYEDAIKLESIAPDFVELLNASCKLLFEDAKNNIQLNYDHFLEQIPVVWQPDIDVYFDAECKNMRTDIKGLMGGTEYVGYAVITDGGGGLRPITRFGYYKRGARLKDQPGDYNKQSVWNKSWYLDPTDGETKPAWGTALEFIGDQEEAEG